jgi:hypothetical protein
MRVGSSHHRLCVRSDLPEAQLSHFAAVIFKPLLPSGSGFRYPEKNGLADQDVTAGPQRVVRPFNLRALSDRRTINPKSQYR